MPLAVLSFRAWSIVVSAPDTPAPAGRRKRHDPAGLAPSQHADLAALDVAARLQEFEGRYDVSGEVVERRLVPVARRSAHASLVIAEYRHPAADEKSGERQQVLAI